MFEEVKTVISGPRQTLSHPGPPDGYPRWGQRPWLVILMMTTMVMIMLATIMMDIQDEGRKIDHQSVVLKELKWPTCPLALMWRYIGTAITDGEFGVLQSKLNLFQIAPPSPCKPPWGDLWSGGSSQTFWYRPTSTYSFHGRRLSFWIIRKKYIIIIITISFLCKKTENDEEHVNWLSMCIIIIMNL